jgi:ElaB/YqjD/DUF883 family membrane-anchored ribosome-binding protein
LEKIAGWFLYDATQEGIFQYQTIADGNTLEIKKESMQRFQELKQVEDMGEKLETQMEGLQNHAEELLAQKDMDCQQVVEQIKAECQVLLEERNVEVEKSNDAVWSRFRHSS